MDECTLLLIAFLKVRELKSAHIPITPGIINTGPFSSSWTAPVRRICQ